VNIAARVEATGVANHVQISKMTWELVKHSFKWKSRGMVELKGKGSQAVRYAAGRTSAVA
jgi:class 3 adenylate cyclase